MTDVQICMIALLIEFIVDLFSLITIATIVSRFLRLKLRTSMTPKFFLLDCAKGRKIIVNYLQKFVINCAKNLFMISENFRAKYLSITNNVRPSMKSEYVI